MDKITLLISKCKAGLTIDVDDHKASYQDIKDQIAEIKETQPELEMQREIEEGIIKNNRLICLTYFPDTPVGSCTIYHYDLEQAVDMALEYFSDRED